MFGDAGVVLAVGHTVKAWQGECGPVPYQVQLDRGGLVLVHRDEHWLVRELALQPAGPRTAADGTRACQKFSKRPAGDGGWEMVDHATRKVRKLQADYEDDDDE